MQLIPGENEGPWTFGPSYATTRLGRHLGNDSGGGNVGCAAQQHCGEWLPTRSSPAINPGAKFSVKSTIPLAVRHSVGLSTGRRCTPIQHELERQDADFRTKMNEGRTDIQWASPPLPKASPARR